MGIESFFTLQAFGSPAQQSVAAKQARPVDGALSGVNFLDFILAQINENAKAQNAGQTAAKTGKEENGILQSDNPLLKKKAGLDLAEILAANPEIEKEIQDFIAATGLPPGVALAQTLELNKQAFDKTLKPLTGGLITVEELEKGSPRILQALLIERDENGGLITTNLTPEDLTALQQLAEKNKTQNGIFAAFVELVSPQTSQQPQTEGEALHVVADITAPDAVADDPALQNAIAIFFAPFAQPQPVGSVKTSTAEQTIVPLSSGDTPAEKLAARLNALTPGASDGEAARGFSIEEYQSGQQFSGKGHENGKGPGHGFETALNAVAKTPAASAGPSPSLHILQGFAYGLEGSLFAPFEMGAHGLDQYGLNTQSSAPATLGTLTAPIMQAQNAAQAPTAAHMIAVSMQKMTGSENKTLTLQLDPPELGRVHVKMDFGPEKTLKAVIFSEKPETHMMLQRDAQMLEKTLQDAGLDTGGGLSFELAEHGFDFDQHNQRGGGHDSGGTGAGGAAENIEILETTMNWAIDPESGHTRYNIMA